MTLASLSFEQIAFQEGKSLFKGFAEIHSRMPTLSSTLFYYYVVKVTVIFEILLHKTVVYQKVIIQ